MSSTQACLFTSAVQARFVASTRASAALAFADRLRATPLFAAG